MTASKVTLGDAAVVAASPSHTSMEGAIRLIGPAQHIAVVTHVAPDPDAIGSLLGLGHSLRELGKNHILLCDDPVPHGLRFLPGSEAVTNMLPEGSAPDVLVALDSSDLERLGKVAQPLLASGIPVLNFDHHITNPGFGTVNVVRAEWAAKAEGLVELVEALEVPLREPAAACLLAGLVGDTRSFSTSSTTHSSLRAAAHLVSAGADIAYVTERLWNRRALDTLRLWGLGLSAMGYSDGVIWTALRLIERQELGLQDADGSGLSNLLISAEEAAISAVFTEQTDGQIDASFRARPGFDVASVAQSIGGGGHALAAGALLTGPLEEVAQRVVGLLRKLVAERPHPVE